MLVIGSLYSFGAGAGDVCDDWFKKSKLKPGPDCTLDCTTLPVDMSTFTCHEACSDFCEVSSTTDTIFKLSDLYPGLTPAERALVSEHPKEAIQVYRDKNDAEAAAKKQFGTNNANDESDACRHFFWANYLRRDIGPDLAQKFLNAHELQPRQNEVEKAMDLANNRLGLLVAERLLKSDSLDEKHILSEFQSALEKKELVVIDRKFKDWKPK